MTRQIRLRPRLSDHQVVLPVGREDITGLGTDTSYGRWEAIGTECWP